jgi:flagellar basal-body rod protein FlgB
MSILDKVYNAIKVTNIRHQVLAENVANASTPNFKTKDLAPNQTGFASTLAINMTSNMHMSGTKKKQDLKIKETRDPNHLKKNGNDVFLPNQMFEISKNQMNQQKLLKTYSYLEDMLRIAVGK